MARYCFLLLFCGCILKGQSQSEVPTLSADDLQTTLMELYELKHEQLPAVTVIIKRFQTNLREIAPLYQWPDQYWPKRRAIVEGMENSLDRLFTPDQQRMLAELRRARRIFRAQSAEKGLSEYVLLRRLYTDYPGTWFRN